MKRVAKIFFVVAVVIGLFKVCLSDVWADELFGRLEHLQIGDDLPMELRQQARRLNEKDLEVYSFESSRYAWPHVVRLMDEKIVFVQVTVPQDRQKEFRQSLLALGEPEKVVEKTKSEVVISFPSKGVAYLVNGYSGEVTRMQQFLPKTVESYVATEAKNYVEQAQPTYAPEFVDKVSVTEEDVSQDKVVKPLSEQSKLLDWSGVSWRVVVGLGVVILALFGGWLVLLGRNGRRWFKRRRNEMEVSDDVVQLGEVDNDMKDMQL